MSIQDHSTMGSLIAKGGMTASYTSGKRRFEVAAIEWMVAGAIALMIALQATQIFVQEINWDEFFFLSQIYDHQRGELTKVLQTIHVHLFGWLPLLSGGEISQITIARVIMLVFELGIMASIYALARVFVSRPAALFSVLAYVSAGFVFLYGTSFRTDPIAACLMMTSLVIIARADWNLRNLGVVALFLGIAAMVTIKVAFYLPALIALGLWRISNAPHPRNAFLRLSACAIAAICVLAAVYQLHESSLPLVSTERSTNMVGSIATAALINGGVFPAAIDLIRGAAMAIVPSLLLIGGLALAIWTCAKTSKQRASHIGILALASPLLSFLFYNNAYPYFFAFIFPPTMVLVGVAIDHFKISGVSRLALIALTCLPTVVLFGRTIQADQVAQAEVIKTVHQMFPAPVPYIDRNSMISSFPKRGVFMSAWGMKSYLKKGEPIFEEILKNETVPLLILNSPTLEEAVGETLSAPLRASLLPADISLLEDNYIAHWGKIWVAGQVHDLTTSRKNVTILIPGYYKIEAKQPIEMDGVNLKPGELTKLKRGTYQLSSPTKQIITFRWGKDLYRPAAKPSNQPIYRGF